MTEVQAPVAAPPVQGVPGRRRIHVRVTGTVQGVGFRPYVHRLATSLGLGGSVRNDERGVVIDLEGSPADLRLFLARLPAEAPPLARVEAVRVDERDPTGTRDFAIVRSAGAGAPSALVTPDAATCPDCLGELFDPADRRYRYPFVNCTNCGPRFTIVRGVPYDRPLTTMAGFAMCAACRAEYEDPADRRFHAQPNACPACGPQARLVDASGAAAVVPAAVDAVAVAADALRRGAVLAVKALGGYHLACRADDEDAVATLRRRKRRAEKPFAIMAGDLEAARALVLLRGEEVELLEGRERPIVLAPRLSEARVAAAAAPGFRDLGVMLPSTPLHHLLLADAGTPLVMTSGNRSDEPIVKDDAEALGRLGSIADLFLVHDRPIATRTDDGVVRVTRVGGRRRPVMLRRSRGHAPAPCSLPVPTARPLLACGAELKSTFCVAKGSRAWVSHHVGDLNGYETLRSFAEGVEHFERLFAVVPEVVAHDLHPDYRSTAYALERGDAELVPVQHHHAHLAACLAEHGLVGPAIGAIYDGTGYGPDGTVWGGEVLVGGLDGYVRAGHLHPVRMPGGDAAVRAPWRMACAWLGEALGEDPGVPRALAGRVDPERWGAVALLARGELGAPVTTSMGRLFDAVAALCGLCVENTYEGQAAIALEMAVDPEATGAYPLPVEERAGRLVLDPRPAVRAVLADLDTGAPVGTVAARFHAAVAAATAHACAGARERHGIDTAVLSGGVFQNAVLLERTAALLAADGFSVLVPERLPPGDGGISYGQAAVAARLTSGRRRTRARREGEALCAWQSQDRSSS